MAGRELTKGVKIMALITVAFTIGVMAMTAAYSEDIMAHKIIGILYGTVGTIVCTGLVLWFMKRLPAEDERDWTINYKAGWVASIAMIFAISALLVVGGDDIKLYALLGVFVVSALLTKFYLRKHG